MLLCCSSILLWIVTGFIESNVRAESSAVIDTTLGPVQGEILKTINKEVPYSSFKGIRYGKPPIGQLRFKPPTFAEPWTEVVNATVAAPDCVQLGAEGVPSGDEDCLFLNVFSPVSDLSESPSELKAVMVWIYGGAFMMGTSNPITYGPDFLIDNDVVVVSLNYRLGPIGFLALNHPEAMGNAGLKDQQLALKWVQENIEKFHGDPTKVTIFGESAGSASVLYQALSDQSQGLFHGVIAISGSPMNPWAFKSSSDAEKNAIELATLLDQNTTDKEQLLAIFRNASAYDLVLYASQLSDNGIPFVPVLEDPTVSPDSPAFLSTCMVEKYESGNFSHVPYMLIFMKDETLLFTGPAFISKLTSTVKNFANETNTSFAIPSLYSVPDGNWTWELVEETSELMFIAGIERVQRYITEHSSQPLYYCKMTFAPLENSVHQVQFRVPAVGTAHGDNDLYIWRESKGIFPLDLGTEIILARERLTRMFTNFAKYDNPTPDGADDPVLNITWPDYGSSQIYLEFDSELRLGESIVNENTEAFIEASEPFLATLKDCPVDETNE